MSRRGRKGGAQKPEPKPGLDDARARLEALGYAYDEMADEWMLGYIVDKVASTIKNDCNVDAVPDGLRHIAADMAVGEFLMALKGCGRLAGFAADLAAAIVKQTQSGDTSVTFAVDGMQTPEQRLDGLIRFLMDSGRGQLAAYRRLKWT